MNKYFSIRILTKSESDHESGKAVAAYVVDQDALIMIARIAEQAQAGILKQILFGKSDVRDS